MIRLTCEAIARAVQGKPLKQVGAEIYWRCLWHDDGHPSFQVNKRKNCFLCGPCNISGSAWELAARYAGVSPDDKPAVTAWLRERGLLNGSSGNASRPSATEQRRVAEFYYSADLRTVRLEPGPDGKTKSFVWEHREGDAWLSGDGGLEKPLYTNRIFRERNQLGIVLAFEGEAKADLAGELGYAAFSFKNLTAAQCAKLAGLDVILWPDKDAPGGKQCNAAAKILRNSKQPRLIRVIAPPAELPPSGDIVDAVRTLGWGKPEIDTLITQATEWQPPQPGTPSPTSAITRSFSEIKPEPLEWLWPGRLPLGKLSLLVGDPGLGKSLLTVDIAARVSRGTSFADGGQCEPGAVIIASAEDDPADTIRPRLDAAGGDVSRIHVLEGMRVTLSDNSTAERSFDLETGIAALEDALARIPGVRLVIIDPISAYLGATDSHSNAEVRGLLSPLAALAAKHNAAILGITHLRKAAGAAVYRAIASIAFTAAARAVWAVACDPEDEERRLLLAVKQNLAASMGGLAFRVRANNGVPRLEWEEGSVGLNADETLSIGAEDRSERREARAWLQGLLLDGPIAVKKIQAEAEAAGLSWATVRRARQSLPIAADKSGYRGGWEWRLEHAQHEDAHPGETDVSAFDQPLGNTKLNGNHTDEGAHASDLSTFGSQAARREPTRPCSHCNGTGKCPCGPCKWRGHCSVCGGIGRIAAARSEDPSSAPTLE